MSNYLHVAAEPLMHTCMCGEGLLQRIGSRQEMPTGQQQKKANDIVMQSMCQLNILKWWAIGKFRWALIFED